jgi:Ser/Thr protein kinase RdoA (MazF antagonist)
VELIEVDGRRGVVFQRIDGPNMSQAFKRSPWRMGHYARLLAQTHAGLHNLSAPTFPSLHGRIRWNLSQACLLTETRKAAILQLLDRLPEDETLCHGDIHPENLILTATGPLVIDWEGSMHGSPAGDVANTCLLIRSALMFGSGPRGWLGRQVGKRFEQAYLAEYERIRGPIDHLPEWLAIHAARRMNEENRWSFRYLDQIIRRVIPCVS